MINLPTISKDSATGSNLAEFAKSKQSNAPFFTIPKLFPTVHPNPMEITSKSEPEKILIDLKSALVSVEQKEVSKVLRTEAKASVEVFIPQFIDCDIIQAKSKGFRTLEQCERVTLSQLRSRFKNYSLKSLSNVGRVIRCRCKRKTPKILHGYNHKHDIVKFTFETPSPDDKILAHLNKNKK
jgi:hypothetical protein